MFPNNKSKRKEPLYESDKNLESNARSREYLFIIERNVNPDSITIYELADMIYQETGIKRECALDVFEMAFVLIDLWTEDNDE